MKISTTANNEIVVQFAGHLRPFRMLQYYCNNPDCPYDEASLEFVEVENDGSVVPNPIRFFFKLDLQTWQECGETKRSDQIDGLVDEFLSDLSDETKTIIREEREHGREHQKKLTNFAMPVDQIMEGRLVSFSEIMSDEKGGYTGILSFGFKFIHEGQTYLIDDLYCPNPKCKCNAAHLAFSAYSEKTGERATLSDAFVATLSFDKKNLDFLELGNFSASQASKLVREWQQAEPDIIETLRWRYREVKKATNRILQGNRKSSTGRLRAVTKRSQMNSLGSRVENYKTPVGLPATPSLDVGLSQDSNVGRNDPCPCGSGKKYKKCCGSSQKTGTTY